MLPLELGPFTKLLASLSMGAVCLACLSLSACGGSSDGGDNADVAQGAESGNQASGNQDDSALGDDGSKPVAGDPPDQSLPPAGDLPPADGVGEPKEDPDAPVTEPGDPGADPGDPPMDLPLEDSCTLLDEEACSGDCSPIYDLEKVYRGCAVADRICTEAETCAQSPEGESVTFPNGCTPAGWTPCDGPGEMLPAAKCESDADCVLCGYSVPPPNTKPATCECAPLCTFEPMHRDTCNQLTKLWAPRVCTGEEQIPCPIAACLAPPPVACVEGMCIAVGGPELF